MLMMKYTVFKTQKNFSRFCLSPNHWDEVINRLQDLNLAYWAVNEETGETILHSHNNITFKFLSKHLFDSYNKEVHKNDE